MTNDPYHVQYTDVNASPKDYSSLASDEVLIINTWPSIQGEGPMAGLPCTFIRTSGCNRGQKTSMSCSFCDTFFLLSHGTKIKINELVTITAPHELVVITGGEPMLQYTLPDLIEALHYNGHTIQIESNGDRLVPGYNGLLSTLVVSPKLTSSSNKYKKLKPAVARELDYLKFLIDARLETGYDKLPEWISEFDKSQIYLSPIAVYTRAVKQGEVASIWTEDLLDREATAKNYAYAAALCTDRGYRLSTQQHLVASVE